MLREKRVRRLVVSEASALPEAIVPAVEVLRAGGVIAYPTETLYGLGADALNPDAVLRVYEIKGRHSRQALPVIVADREMLAQVASRIPPAAIRLAETFWPGPLTLVLPARRDLPAALLGGGDTIAVRVSGSLLCCELSRMLGRPVTATSANLSGEPDLRTAEEIEQVLGDRVDLILDAGPARGTRPSTVVDCSGEKLRILRVGVIPPEELKERVPDLDWT
jgi:L-threonylcarbamoyladenylate synthase